MLPLRTADIPHISVYEPPAEYVPAERDGMIQVRCDCSCTMPCPQGRRGSGSACFVWMRADRFKRSVLAEMRKPVRR
jgi:hypothetical protein